MKHFEVNVKLRTDLGKKATKKIRKEKSIPCVIYGGEQNIHFYGLQSDFRKLIYTHEVMFVDINIENKKSTAVIKEIQFHPVSDEVIHMDFLEVNPSSPLKIKIPIKVVGTSPGVRAGGNLNQRVRTITVKGMMNDIPDSFEINIDKLKIGQTIKVKDLVSNKLEFLDPKSNVIIAITSTRGVTIDETIDADEESAE
jgi:large subunit ribosomal protein L25